MCITGGYVGKLIEAIEKEIACDHERVGTIILRPLPPRLFNPAGAEIRDAVGATITVLGQMHREMAEQFVRLFDEMPGTSPEDAAKLIVQLARDVAFAQGLARNNGDAVNLGTARIHFFLLNAVFALFLDNLVRKYAVTDFAERVNGIKEDAVKLEILMAADTVGTVH